MTDIFTAKQSRVISDFKHERLRRLNILEGSVRSGKTWISLILWALWVATMPRNGNFLMVAKTLTSLRRNCLDLLEELVGSNNFCYSISKKEGALFGRRIYLEGVNDARAESKIRGMTLTGAYCDEVTLFTEDFFSMLLSRLSTEGAKLIGTTNPDSPYHWLKEKYLERKSELDIYSVKFLIEDNTYLCEDYVENLKKEYTGVFYDRFIRGEWVVANGLVYPNFDESKHVFDYIPPTKDDGLYYISIDYGTANPCSMGLWRVADGKAMRIAEYYHDGRKTRHQMTDEEYYSALETLAGDKVIQYVVVDPSAASFIATIKRHGVFSVKKAANDVLDGIRVTAALLSTGRVLFDRSCADTIKEFRTYSWDDKATADTVVKENDHAMDDIRYFCYSVLRREWHWDDWAVT